MVKKQQDEENITDQEKKIPFEESKKALERKIDLLIDDLAKSVFSDPQIQDELFRSLNDSKKILQQKDDPEGNFFIANYTFTRASQRIYREKQQSKLGWLIPIIIILYVFAISSLIIFIPDVLEVTGELPVVNVPLSVVVWAAIGSLGAILYRFYSKDLGFFSVEIRWLIARPIIGIIMGSIAYLSIISGLLIFGGPSGNVTGVQESSFPLLLVVAFLGGFSDKFFESVIKIAIGRFSGKDTSE